MRAADQTKPAAPTENAIDTFGEAGSAYAAMIKAIAAARTSIYFANFCFESGIEFRRFSDALTDAANRGVAVFVIADAYGSRHLNKAEVAQLQQAGVNWVWFQPWRPLLFWRYNRRMHKKLLIVDDKEGFTGGMGVADFWTKPAFDYPKGWRDTHFRLEGPITADMIASFTSTWKRWSKTPLPEPTEPTGGGRIKMAAVESRPQRPLTIAGRLYCELIEQAKSSVTITTAYFGPNRRMRQALMAAARRGVEVSILVNGSYNTHGFAAEAGRRWYGRLLKAGVTIYEYQPTKIHAKLMTVDHKVTTIGSANFNYRSLHHDEEFNIVVNDQAFSKRIEQQFGLDLENSKPITAEEWAKRGGRQSLRQFGHSLGRYFY